MANSVVIKSRADCTDLQKKFLTALESPECARQPRDERWRWAATQAGYSSDTSISDIIAPMAHLVKEVAESILLRASVEAAWTLSDAAGHGAIDAQTKDRIAASRDILDRTVPKKGEDVAKSTAPVAVLVLPAKHEAVKLVQVSNEDISTIKEG